jgi:hypothetical protein
MNYLNSFLRSRNPKFWFCYNLVQLRPHPFNLPILIYFNVILLCTYRPLPFRFSYNYFAFLFCLMYATCSANLVFIYFITQTTFLEVYNLRNSSLLSFLQSPFIFLPLRSKYPLSASFPQTLCPCSSLNAGRQIPQPYKTLSNNTVLCILVFVP